MRKFRLLTTTVILSMTLLSAFRASAQLTIDSAYQVIQSTRDYVGKILNNPHYTRADVKRSLHLLDSVYRFVDSSALKTNAYENYQIKFRFHDLFRDIGEVYAMNNQLDSAMVYFNKSNSIASFSSSYREVLEDTTERAIWSDPRFVDLLEKMRFQGRLMHDSAFQTPYVADLPYEQKVAGLTLLWSQAKYNFVYFDHAKIDWDQTYLDFLPKIKATTSTKEYYRVLQRFYASLKDGHTNVYPPDTLDRDFYSRPPITTALIESRVFVTGVRSDSLETTGIVPGLEILSIDGTPVIEYAEKNIAPYESSSTPQDMKVREFTYGLLSGPDVPVALTFKDKTGKVWSRSVPRSGYHHLKPWKTYEWRVIGNIGYLALNDFEHYGLVKVVDSLFPEIAKTAGLVIDVRNNGGGSGNIGFNILAMLTDKPFAISTSWNRENYSMPGMEIVWHFGGNGSWLPSQTHYYNKPVALLIGPETFSAAEDFTVAFELMHRGPLVGRSTGGSTGQPVGFRLPGGGSARVCGKRDTYPDGSEFVGKGVHPTAPVEPTIRDLRLGDDAALQKAIDLLHAKIEK